MFSLSSFFLLNTAGMTEVFSVSEICHLLHEKYSKHKFQESFKPEVVVHSSHFVFFDDCCIKYA